VARQILQLVTCLFVQIAEARRGDAEPGAAKTKQCLGTSWLRGVSKVIFSLTIRPFPNWGWVLVSGIVGILLSLYLLASFPVSYSAFSSFAREQLSATWPGRYVQADTSVATTSFLGSVADWAETKSSFSKPPLTLLELPQCPQKIDSSKSWPIYIREVEFAENALPQQES
jgi:hypothetical protein